MRLNISIMITKQFSKFGSTDCLFFFVRVFEETLIQLYQLCFEIVTAYFCHK